MLRESHSRGDTRTRRPKTSTGGEVGGAGSSRSITTSLTQIRRPKTSSGGEGGGSSSSIGIRMTSPMRSFITSTNSFNSRVHTAASAFPKRHFSIVEFSAKERYLRNNSHLLFKNKISKQTPQQMSLNTLAIQNSPAREMIEEIPEAEVAAYKEVRFQKNII
jgi:hypothetical protein